MENRYKVELEAFQGPLGLLLQLIENNELEITKVSLTKVADQYISYINSNPHLPAEEIADFLVVAAKLIYLKSKALLPTIDLEQDGIDLDKQLKMYKLYLDATKQLIKMIAQKNFNFAKDKYPTGLIEGFNPPKKVSLEKMKSVLELMLKRIEPVLVLPKKHLERVVSIKEKIQHIRDTVLKFASTTFSKIISDKYSRGEKIVSFLALLELVKQRVVSVDQQDRFSEITIIKNEGAEVLAYDTSSDFK